MRLTNKYGLPDAIIRAITNDPYSRGNSDISATQLITPPRIRQLMSRHHDKLEEDASQRIASLIGQLGHLLVERANAGGLTGDIQEQRLYMPTDCGWVVSGQVDLFKHTGDKPGFFINDFKFTTAYKVQNGDHADWTSQLNIYRALADHNEIGPITGLQIIAILKDWAEWKVGKEQNYPEAPVVVIPIELWSEEKAKTYVNERARLHRASEEFDDNDLPFCTNEERWARPGKFKIMKPGAIRATRAFETREEADAYLEDQAQAGKDVSKLNVYQELGRFSRCEKWCPARPFCNQVNSSSS